MDVDAAAEEAVGLATGDGALEPTGDDEEDDEALERVLLGDAGEFWRFRFFAPFLDDDEGNEENEDFLAEGSDDRSRLFEVNAVVVGLVFVVTELLRTFGVAVFLLTKPEI